MDRAGLQNEWENIDEETQEEIRKTWEGIIIDALGGADRGDGGAA